jgi:hypothetical protein
MRQGLAASLPDWESLEHVAKTIAAIGGIVGGAWAVCVRVLRRRRAERERHELEQKAIRYLLDAMRHTLHVMTPDERGRLIDVGELERQKVLVDQVRDQLWIADGHQSERDAEAAAAALEKWLTRTQAIEAKERGGNPFRDGWTPEED